MSSATSWRYGYLQQRPACFGLSTVPLPPGSSSRRQKLGSRLSSGELSSAAFIIGLPFSAAGTPSLAVGTRTRTSTKGPCWYEYHQG